MWGYFVSNRQRCILIFIKKYLGKHIFIRVFSKNNINIFNIDFLKNNIEEINFLPYKRNNVIVNVNAYVINDVCRKFDNSNKNKNYFELKE